MDRFAQLLFDLGQLIGTDLYPDAKRLCQLNFEDQLHIQISYDETKEQLLMASFLCEVPPGKYRETLFKEALKVNNEFPRTGTLSYSPRNNQLSLHEFVYAPQLKPEKLLTILSKFIKKGVAWKEAVEKALPLPPTPK